MSNSTIMKTAHTLVVDRIKVLQAMQRYLLTQTHLCQGEVAISFHKDDLSFKRPILSAAPPQGIAYTGLSSQQLDQSHRSGVKPGLFPVIDRLFNRLPSVIPSAYWDCAEWCNLITLWNKGLDSRSWIIACWSVKNSSLYMGQPRPHSITWLDHLYFKTLS